MSCTAWPQLQPQSTSGPQSAAAGDSIEEAHITPRVRPSVDAGAHASNGLFPGPFGAAQPLRSNVDLVLVNVTVLDHANRVVTGLDADSFSVLDGEVKQNIKYLSTEDSPISLTVIVDASGSMAGKMTSLQQAVLELFRYSNPQDEWRLIVFGDRPQEMEVFPDSLEDLQRAFQAVQPSGETAMWDAMYLGIAGLKNARYQRKAVVLISDGGDNHSRYAQKDIQSLVEESDVEVYAIGLFEHAPKTFEERRGPLVLDEITSSTGGRMITAHDRADLVKAGQEISRELRSEYVLGYAPANRARDGKWRSLKVKVTPPPGQSKLYLYFKNGYYGPAK